MFAKTTLPLTLNTSVNVDGISDVRLAYTRGTDGRRDEREIERGREGETGSSRGGKREKKETERKTETERER